jgi:hypothetical protein
LNTTSHRPFTDLVEFNTLELPKLPKEDEREEGISQGAYQRAMEDVKNLRDFGMEPNQIAGALKLPLDTILRYLGD